MELDLRKRRVLRVIVEEFVATAEPVGSRRVAERSALDVSPATIRNEMGELEAMGYLEQPHTSAGRVPSDKGYRFYVDELMEAEPLAPAEVRRLRRALAERIREVQGLVQLTARLLADATACLAMVVGPQLEATRIRAVRLAPLGLRRALLVMVTDAGFVISHVVELPPAFDEAELEPLERLLSRHLGGHAPGGDVRRALRVLDREVPRLHPLLEQAEALLAQDLEPGGEERVYLGGAANLLGQPEFRDVQRARALLALLEQERLVRELLARRESAGVEVTIGQEHPHEALHGCSVVAGSFSIGDRAGGRVAVLGPTRMPYRRVVPFVKHVADSLSELLTRAVGS